MAEKIGKYQLLERIGRGGMGTIFRAHDPILDRPVALKVISTEVEVTDELRARFFREAQACARLSHPNIVTVYDMGEDAGRLFIVMELLEGEELRRLITQRTALALEDKLAIMAQVCAGLHYAHQKGIVHRDIKPGNILVQRNGQVKILDFGIAQIAATEGGLTRTGLIMGTLRYISPEQVRGRADARSDMFSVGAVFYELLSLRPPFTGEDPMHLLEQLRTEEPPRLSELDVAIPVEVAAIVERAMRKEPGERFADLEEMRGEIAQVQRGFAEEAQRERARVRAQRDQVLQLQAALAERVGPPRDTQEVAAIEERGRLATVRALARDFADRIEMLRVQLARADRLAGAVHRGIESLEEGQCADAVMELEAVVAEMPEHGRAVEALGRARAGAAEERRRQLAAKLVREARAALEEGGFTLGLELLRQADEIPPPAEAALEIARLRESAEAAHEAARRARQRAEGAREQMGQAWRAADAESASQYAAALWAEAERKAGEGQAAFVREAYAEAGEAFGAAAAAYRRGAAAAREEQLRQRNAVDLARDLGVQGQRGAEAAGASQYARELWDTAEAKFAEGQAAVARKTLGGAVGSFNEAAALYRRAEEAAGAARQRERRRAEEARDRAVQEQRIAEEADVEQHAATLWGEASTRSEEGRAALEREQFGTAADAFSAAAAAYHQAENQAREVRREQREQAAERRQAMVEGRRHALAADAASQARADWNEAEENAMLGEAAFARAGYAEASRAFDQGVTLYRRAADRAREAVRALDLARADAEKGREAAALARGNAAEAQAAKYAADQWRAGESAEAEGTAASSRQDYAGARSLFTEARRQYAAAARGAGIAAEAESRRADAMTGNARQLLEAGDVAGCLRRVDEVLVLKPGHAGAEGLRREAEERRRQAETATRGTGGPAQDVTVYSGQTAGRVEPAMVPEEPPPQETIALDETRLLEATVMTPPVPAAPAPRMLPAGWRRFRWRTLAIAAAVLLGIGLSIHWLVPPLLTSHRLQSEAEEARKHVDATRDQAMTVEANTLARDLFDRAAAKDMEAKQLTDARRFDAAIDVLREAAGRYEEAGRVATPIREARGTADQTRTRMLAEKARAAPGAAEFREALAREQEGADSYQRLAFREATDKFLAAAQLFSKAVPPTVTAPPEPPKADTQTEIREVLRLYSRVFEAKDLDLLRRIRPRILPDELSRHRDVFAQTRSYRLNLRVDGITVSGDEAEARGRREDIVVAGNGETFRTPGQFMFRLKRVDNRWTIDAVK